ncbi:MAG: glycoside hydrolase [Citrobacter freundii]|nr:MAG: glycoside hydrolase [Citrobacter freundii]
MLSITHGVFAQSAQNPIIFADVPDQSIIRVGNTYYMSSTTMHMSPGVPIMKSTDFVNWKLVSYAYDKLDSVDALNLENGKNAYGQGSWASSLRYHNGRYYVTTFAQTTGKTYIYTTTNIEKGPWTAVSFRPSLHDHSLFFDDDGKIYLVNGSGKIILNELSDDLSGIKPGTEAKVIIENASLPAGNDIGLPAEGSQLFKVNGYYYLFNIVWPRGGMRTVLVHRATAIAGPYEGKVMLQDKGVAQGGLISTPAGTWYAYLFQDHGAVGRIPYLVPVTWKDGWPEPAGNGKVPDQLTGLPASRGLIPGIVCSDEFSRKKGERSLPLVWQWNHNPDNAHWSLQQRPGYFRIINSRTDSSVLQARNTLTQRTVGPWCTAVTAIDATGMKDGDIAGMILLQKQYGWVGIKTVGDKRSIVMTNADSGKPIEVETIPVTQAMIYLKAVCDFRDKADKGYFYYSLDGKQWHRIGSTLNMRYTLPHFMGYRFGLFSYGTKEKGGYADFDFFRIDTTIPNTL